jgi:hypothetical protein
MRRAILLMFTLAVIIPSGAMAQTSIATAAPAALGQVKSVSAAASTSYYFNYYLQPNRSYAAICWHETATAAAGSAVFIQCTASIRDASDAMVGSGGGFFAEPIAAGGSWQTYTATTNLNYFVRATNSITPGTLRVAMVETTLFSPWYFVNSVSGYEAFVEMKNTTAGAVTVKVTALAANGTQAGTPSTVSIPANGNTFVAVGSGLGAPDGSGGVQITHNGAPGAIVANVTTLSGSTGLSFDSPATPRMAWSMFQ